MVKGTLSMEPPAAQFYRQRIGAVELIALSDGGLNYPTAMIFGNVPPAWDYWMSADPSTVEAEALRHHLELLVNEARRAFEQNTLVFAHHLGPFPNIGRIVKKGDSWQWEPIETTG